MDELEDFLSGTCRGAIAMKTAARTALQADEYVVELAGELEPALRIAPGSDSTSRFTPFLLLRITADGDPSEDVVPGGKVHIIIRRQSQVDGA